MYVRSIIQSPRLQMVTAHTVTFTMKIPKKALVVVVNIRLKYMGCLCSQRLLCCDQGMIRVFICFQRLSSVHTIIAFFVVLRRTVEFVCLGARRFGENANVCLRSIVIRGGDVISREVRFEFASHVKYTKICGKNQVDLKMMSSTAPTCAGSTSRENRPKFKCVAPFLCSLLIFFYCRS